MKLSRLKKLSSSPFAKGIINFSSGAFVALFLSIVLQFLLPKFLSVEDFGVYKAFTLYLGYLSLLHFGLKDGIYLRLCEINSKPRLFTENNLFYSYLFFQQLVIAVIGISIALLMPADYRLFILILSIAAFLSIVVTYFESFYQSLKEFRLISYLKILRESIVLVLVGIFIFANINLGINALLYFIVIKFILVTVLYKYLTRQRIKFVPLQKIINKKGIILHVYKRGFKLLTGNFGHQLNTNIDKLFVSIYFSSSEFAIYSFGGVFFVLSNTLVTSFSTVLLPFLHKDFKEELNSKYQAFERRIGYMLALFLPYLTVVVIVVKYLYPEYSESVRIIAFLSFGMMFNIIISVVQNNYFKVLKKEKVYVIINYSTIALFMISMMTLLMNKADISKYAILTSVMFFLRYLANEVYLRKELRLPFGGIVPQNLIIIIVGTGVVFLFKLIMNE